MKYFVMMGQGRQPDEKNYVSFCLAESEGIEDKDAWLLKRGLELATFALDRECDGVYYGGFCNEDFAFGNLVSIEPLITTNA